jgi:hypothetical protein
MMHGFACPLHPSHDCPYPTPVCQANDTKPDSCADSWTDDDGCLVREAGGEWHWTGGRE